MGRHVLLGGSGTIGRVALPAIDASPRTCSDWSTLKYACVPNLGRQLRQHLAARPLAKGVMTETKPVICRPRVRGFN